MLKKIVQKEEEVLFPEGQDDSKMKQPRPLQLEVGRKTVYPSTNGKDCRDE